MLSRRKTSCLAILLSALIGCNSGDRVLVEKFPYDAGVGKPKRFDVVVFRFPGTDNSPGPTENNVPKNYIKRLMGLPGQLLAIFFGQIFFYQPPEGEPPFFDDNDGKIDPNDLWKPEFMHIDHARSQQLWEQAGMFQIARKSPEVMLAMRRIVSDFDFAPPAKDLPPRWFPDEKGKWIADQNHGFDHAGANEDNIDWIHYQHILYPWQEGPEPRKPGKELIVDFMGYNSQIPPLRGQKGMQYNANWVGNLMIECQVKVERGQGEFWLELNKGINRFQACFDLGSGKCSLFKVDDMNKKTELLKSADTRVKGPGQYSLRLANFDARLTLWVDDDLPFGEGVDYAPPEVRSKEEKNLTKDELLARSGPRENDLNKPASIGSKNAVAHVQQIRLWRDTYYTTNLHGPDNPTMKLDDWGDSNKWEPLRKLPVLIMYVQPGHYLCLGDNSPASSDSRDWGLVPQRLMLGRALMVYYPFPPFGPNRAGFIR